MNTHEFKGNFNIAKEQSHFFPFTTFQISKWHIEIDIFLFTNGIYTFANVVIVDFTHANLFFQETSIHDFAT